MSQVCEITGKKPGYGNLRSHSNRATRRRFLPNLITKRVLDPKTGQWKKMKIAVSTLRTLSKQHPKAVQKALELLK